LRRAKQPSPGCCGNGSTRSKSRSTHVRQTKDHALAKQKITPYLWFDTQAEEAALFYTSLFKDSRIVSVNHYGDAGPRPKGSVLTVVFELAGQSFVALNGGPQFPFTEAISLFVNCDTQTEVDALWEKLLEGGQAQMCGWLKDRYGVSWQIVPGRLGEMLADPDPVRAQRVTEVSPARHGGHVAHGQARPGCTRGGVWPRLASPPTGST